MRHLLETHESWSDEGGEFTHVGYVIAWEENGKVFRLEHEGTTFDLEQLEAPSPIPPEYLTTPWLSGYVEAPQPLPPATFVKSIPPIRYTPHAPMVPSQLMRKEIELYTALSRAPHPNICPFYGCVRDGQRATALVLKKVPHELPDQWRFATPDIIVPKLVILRGVKRGLDHLHNLGIVHNDINKANILLDESLDPVIIDFNIALPEGEPRDEWLGTPGWFKKSSISSRENDIFALGLIAKWLDGWEEDPSSFIELEEPCSWTEDYLAPKILAVGASSRLYNDILSRASYLGAYLTLLNVPESDSLDIPSRLLNERIKTTSANSHEEYIQVWAEACAGLRSKELDVVFFPISKHILDPNSEQLRQLRNLIAAIPYNLRLLRMQPRLILFDVDSSAFGPSEVLSLETVLRTLTQECWKDGASNMNKHVPNSDDHRNGDGVEALEIDAPRNTNDVFGNFVLAQPGGWFSWSRLRVRLWQTVGAPSVPSFERTSHLVAPDDLVGFVLEPPRRRRSSSWRSLASATTRVMGIDDPALFTFVFAQAALTVYAAYKLAWAN